MPSPAITLKLKRFRQRFGITAPRVSVRTHYGWYWYAAGLVLLVLVVVAGTWWLAQHDEVVQTRNELERLRLNLAEAEVELARLRTLTGTEQSAVRMERSTQQQLAARLKALETENATLRADLALFDKLVPSVGVESVLRVERLSLVSGNEPGRYRYRLLLAFQPSKAEREFRGNLQLLVTVLQSGKEMVINLPSSRDVAADFQVQLRHFLRKEGSLVLPAGGKVRKIEARILQGGVLKAKQTINY